MNVVHPSSYFEDSKISETLQKRFSRVSLKVPENTLVIPIMMRPKNYDELYVE